jgi:hypothetical protein
MDYYNEFKLLVAAIDANPKIPVKNMLIGPSLATGPWDPEKVWETPYLDTFAANLYAITMEKCVSSPKHSTSPLTLVFI